MPDQLATALTAAKLASGLTWRELGERAHCSAGHLCLAARGQRLMTVDVAQRVDRALHRSGVEAAGVEAALRGEMVEAAERRLREARGES